MKTITHYDSLWSTFASHDAGTQKCNGSINIEILNKHPPVEKFPVVSRRVVNSGHSTENEAQMDVYVSQHWTAFIDVRQHFGK